MPNVTNEEKTPAVATNSDTYIHSVFNTYTVHLSYNFKNDP